MSYFFQDITGKKKLPSAKFSCFPTARFAISKSRDQTRPPPVINDTFFLILYHKKIIYF